MFIRGRVGSFIEPSGPFPLFHLSLSFRRMYFYLRENYSQAREQPRYRQLNKKEWQQLEYIHFKRIK